MSLKISSVQNQGNASDEYVVFKASADINVNQYMVEDNTFSGGKFSNVHRHPFRFPSKTVKKDEYVVLYTRKGTNGEGKMDNGAKFYSFYWGSDAAIWNNEGDKVVLLKVDTAETFAVGKP